MSGFTTSAQRDSALMAVYNYAHCTSLELHHKSGLGRHMLARRLPDLLKMGLVARTEKARKCRYSQISGNSAVWRLTSKGGGRIIQLQRLERERVVAA